jgi:hypothetical protein
MSRILIDITGQRFGRLTVIQRAPYDAFKGTSWECLCDCGNRRTVFGPDLKNKRIVSCGCFRRENSRKLNTTHGDSTTVEYEAWCGMKRRCTKSDEPDWKLYGGRGIKVCDEWINDYPAFLAHIGRRPSPEHSIDRIDNDGNYEPGNVRWATPKEQRNNQRQ